MFFYRKTELRADTEEELLTNSECPLCKNRLHNDWAMPLRYNLGTFLLILAVAMLCGLLMALEMMVFDCVFGWELLGFFDSTTQAIIERVFLISTSLMASFFLVGSELSVSRVPEGKLLYGLHCPTCGNGFAGVVPVPEEENARGVTEVPNENQ